MHALSRRIGPYLLIEPLGRGGMGVVWHARHHASGQPVALKTVRVPRVGMLAGIRREIHCLARLRHPGIVRILDEGLDEGLPWYAMERIEGLTLRQTVARLHSGPDTAETPPATDVGNGASSPQDGTTSEPLERRSLTRTLDGEGATDPASTKNRDATTEPADRKFREPAHSRAPAEAEAQDRPKASYEAWRAPLTLIRKLCGALAYLHGEGLAHRDLKPDNVLVRPDGTPVLVDFGLARRFSGDPGREALDLGEEGLGTFAYMAPEQIRGSLPDARTDLYALGCILYELLTGHRPFVGATLAELVKAHFKSEPVAPSEVVAGLPADLDALVMELLRKEPRERLGHAHDVAASLARLGAEDWLPGAAPAARDYLYRPALAGRAGVLSDLSRAVDRLAHGDGGGLVLVGGESGVGKTRLAAELAQEVDRHRVHVLMGECEASHQSGGLAGPGLHPLRRALQAVADRCRAAGVDETRRLLGPQSKLLARYEPALSQLPGQEADPEPAELPAEASRVRLFQTLVETFRALVEPAVAASHLEPAAYGRRPLLLVLDDLQWADELTLEWLDFLLQGHRLDGMPLLILGTYRIEELRPALQRLLERPRVTSLRLGRLEDNAVGRIAGEMLAMSTPPEALVRFLARQCEGNPFFVGEYLRAAVAEGLLRRDTQGRWQMSESVASLPETSKEGADSELSMPLPRSLRALIGRRLEGLAALSQRLVQAAAIAGRNVQAGIAGQVAGLSAQEWLEATAELLERSVLEEGPGGQLRFAHDKLREVAYEAIDSSVRVGLHRAAAEAIESLPQTEREEQLAVLGRHWELGGVPVKARSCYLDAARRAAHGYAYHDAERLYRACLRLPGSPEVEMLAARRELGWEILFKVGNTAEALEQVQLALADAQRLGEASEEAQCLLWLGEMNRVGGRYAAAREALERSLAIQRGQGDLRFAGRGAANLGLLCHDQGRVAEAEAHYDRALSFHREAGDRQYEGTTLSNYANLVRQMGRNDEAAAMYIQSLNLLREIGNRRMEGVVLGNLAVLRQTQGRLDEARAHYEEALTIARSIGDHTAEGSLNGNMATLLYAQDRLDEAARLCDRAVVIHAQIGDRPHEGFYLGNLATILLELGRVDEARQSFEQALGIHHQVGSARNEAICQSHMATMERRCALELCDQEGILRQVEARLLEVRDPQEHFLCMCERAHQSLAAGKSAKPVLLELQRLATELGLEPQSDIRGRLVRAEKAQAAFDDGDGHQLFRGELIEDLPHGLRRWLVETGRLEPERAGV